MSTSASDPTLTVYGDSDAELYVIGSDLRTVAYGVRWINQPLPAGLYKVRAVRGGTTKERLIELSGQPLSVTMKIEEFGAVAPIGPVFGIHSTAIEAVAQKAVEAGSRYPAPPGPDLDVEPCRLLVLGHMAAREDGGDPLADMRLFPWRQVAARQTLDCEVPPERIGEENWRGWFRHCRPGCHVLELYDGTQWVRQAVLVAPGWETRVFVQRGSPVVAADRSAAPVRPEISIQMAAPNSPVVYQDHYQTVEVARRALETNRPIIVADHLVADLLEGKWVNPVMGLTGLHLFLEALERRDAPDAPQMRRVDLSGNYVKKGREVVREVLENLHKLLRGGGRRRLNSVQLADLTGPVPADLAGLETRAARFLDAQQEPLAVVDHPPMFWASWVALRDVPANKARYQVQHRLWAATAHSIAAGPYFCWQPKRVSLSGYVNTALQTAALMPIAATASTTLSPYFAILGMAAALTDTRAAKPSRRHLPGALDLGESRADIGKALGIPESVFKAF